MIAFILLINCITFSSTAPRIGIIGAGISGSSLAHFLRHLGAKKSSRSANNLLFDVEVFEQAAQAGGRLATADINGRLYETGGSIIHSRNKYMNDFVKLLGLQKRKQFDDGKFGIFNGEKIVFGESDYTIVTLFNLVRRYGLDPFHFKRYINLVLGKFETIYGLQAKNLAYKNVKEMLQNIDGAFYNDSTESFRQKISADKFGQHFVQEILGSILKANYGQSLEIGGFVGSVGVAGAGSDLWAVYGGNRLVPEGLLKMSQAKLNFGKKVTKIAKKSNNRFVLSGENENFFGEFDAVVMATPIFGNGAKNFEFENLKIDGPFQKFHTLYVNFVVGQLKPKFSHLAAIIMCCGYDQLNSIGLNSPVDGNNATVTSENVYKIFSNNPLTTKDAAVLEFFENYEIKHKLEWLAYPEYENEYKYAKSAKFELTDGVYYVNAVEAAASAMEMSCIGAKNVASLIFEKFYKTEIKKRVEKEL